MNNRHPIMITLSRVLLVGVLLLPVACGSPGEPERVLRGVLEQALEAVHERRPGPVVALVSPRYRDEDGRDHDDMVRLIRGWFLSFSEMRITVRSVEFSFPGPGVAESRLQVLATGRRGGGLPDADAMEVVLEWVEVAPGEWQVIGARWRRLRG